VRQVWVGIPPMRAGGGAHGPAGRGDPAGWGNLAGWGASKWYVIHRGTSGYNSLLKTSNGNCLDICTSEQRF